MSILLTQSPILIAPVIVAFFGGYLSGSVPYGLLLGKIFGHGDIRKHGSGNIGATNMLRVGGKKLAIATLLLDALKGFVPVTVASGIHMDYAVLAALGAILGHLFPVWLKFKGGKGVATGLGVAFALTWKLGFGLCGIWLLVAGLTSYSSLSAIAAFALAPLLAGILTGNFQIILTVFIISVLIIAKHHQNIARLIKGTEGKINLNRKS